MSEHPQNPAQPTGSREDTQLLVEDGGGRSVEELVGLVDLGGGFEALSPTSGPAESVFTDDHWHWYVRRLYEQRCADNLDLDARVGRAHRSRPHDGEIALYAPGRAWGEEVVAALRVRTESPILSVQCEPRMGLVRLRAAFAAPAEETLGLRAPRPARQEQWPFEVLGGSQFEVPVVVVVWDANLLTRQARLTVEAWARWTDGVVVISGDRAAAYFDDHDHPHLSLYRGVWPTVPDELHGTRPGF